MFFQKDYILRQIEMVGALARIVLGKDPRETITLEEDHSSAGDPLSEKLNALLAQARVNEAEQALFDALDVSESAPEPEKIHIALAFYERINRWSDEELREAGFDRSEIREGLDSLARRYGINID